jgi:hypothetical protein
MNGSTKITICAEIAHMRERLARQVGVGGVRESYCGGFALA